MVSHMSFTMYVVSFKAIILGFIENLSTLVLESL
jgi:hypothetical protein